MTTLITSSLLHSVSAKMEMHPSHNSHLEKSPNCCGPHWAFVVEGVTIVQLLPLDSRCCRRHQDSTVYHPGEGSVFASLLLHYHHHLRSWVSSTWCFASCSEMVPQAEQNCFLEWPAHVVDCIASSASEEMAVLPSSPANTTASSHQHKAVIDYSWSMPLQTKKAFNLHVSSHLNKNCLGLVWFSTLQELSWPTKTGRRNVTLSNCMICRIWKRLDCPPPWNSTMDT